ncbi:hypothetical protein E2C01_040714 [Portunus trituberculatus]|uniref:Uncharacterized protein n=1 Tax=Portunus trituberculatus TaxID=210409 RepID=A0A5B7FHE1_PORTR|nr:hypothetical protein [Portunus trituberculatus]
MFILSKLTYASPAWETWSPCLTTTLLNCFERTQKRAIKVIFGSIYTTYNATLATLQGLHLSTLTDHYAASIRTAQ